MLDPENVGVAFGILLLSSVEAEILHLLLVLQLLAAIFNLLNTWMLE
jgi:hypothetical protein